MKPAPLLRLVSILIVMTATITACGSVHTVSPARHVPPTQPVATPSASAVPGQEIPARVTTGPIPVGTPTPAVSAVARVPTLAPVGDLAVTAQQALVNSDRAGAGLGPLAWNGCLAGVAAQNAQRMAAADAISHADGPSRDLACGLGSAQGGENVGYWSAGISDGQLNAMFMASSGHRSNIMGPYHHVGTAWTVAPDGHAYIAVEFA